MQLFDSLPPHIEDALRASIDRFGVLQPIIVWRQTGEVLDGNHRQRIAADLDVECPKRLVDAEDEDEARAIAVTLNADRRHLDPAQRREVVAHLRGQGHSYRAIGDALDVSPQTAMRDAATVPDGTVQPETVRGLDGKERPAVRKVTHRESKATTVETPQPSPDLTPEPDRLAPMMSSDTPEWYTPADLLDRATKVLDGIGLDPCSNSHDNPNVPAEHHWTAADDGLAQPWMGTVWMNPPYGRGIDRWVWKLYKDYTAGRTTAAIALVPARTDTRWFRVLRDYPVCFLNGRVRFLNGNGDVADPAPFPSAAIYLGDATDLFSELFSPIGDVYVRWGE